MFEELAGDVALQASGDLTVGFSFGSPAFGVGAGSGIGAESAKHDDVDRSVELAVT